MSDRRFVILLHDHPFRHWDLLIEKDDCAETWRLMRKPCLNEPIYAEPIADHRLMYLDYEGPVSGNRGQVTRVLRGIVSSDATSSGGDVERVLELTEQDFATRAIIFRSEDQRCFVQFSRD